MHPKLGELTKYLIFFFHVHRKFSYGHYIRSLYFQDPYWGIVNDFLNQVVLLQSWLNT